MPPAPRTPIRSAAGLLAAGLALLAAEARSQSSTPPPVAVNQTSAQVGDGLIFLTPSPLGQVPPGEVSSIGPEIVDNLGRPVWFLPLPSGSIASDLRIQTYQGNPVLTWAQGPGFQVTQAGSNTDYICDTSYNVIATVQAGNGLNADEHEFLITPEDTALITIYNNVPADLSSVGGPANGAIQEGVVQEIDIATGTVLLEWHSLDHVPIGDSYAPVPPSGNFDYFHINSVNLDTDGNLLISSRHTWTVYKVNRQTGAVIWRLGGKESDFTLGPGLPFAWQHDAMAVDASTLRIFDNESNGTPVLPTSRVIWVRHDDIAMTATLVTSVEQPEGRSVIAEGNAEALPNGNTFVGWGILGRFSEFDPNGALLFDASLPPGYNDYRSYRFPWSATPAAAPTATAQLNADGTTTVHAVWNGATGVALWNIMGGAAASTLSQVGTVPWNGLDTQTTLPGQFSFVQVVALNSSGAAIGSSAASGAAPAFTAQPVSQTVADGGTAVFSASAIGPAVSYQWSLNGVPLADGASNGATFLGAAGPTLLVSGATGPAEGTYTCTATGTDGLATSAPAVLALSDTVDAGRITNVSARSQVGTGQNVLIAGYVVGGSQATGTEDLLVRASGPSLSQFGLTGLLPDPELVLTFVGSPTDATKTVAAWGGSAAIANAAAAVGAFPWENASSLDAATVRRFHVGSHTAEVVGSSGDTGVALAEVYDETPEASYTPSTPHLLNVSARALVGTGANILIAGFAIGGQTAKTVLIRASGPALSALGFSGTLADPQVQLFATDSSTTPLASNGAWAGDPTIAAAAAAAGAFGWQDPASHDAAILVTLPPGSYTAQVTGQSADTGLALVEVYEVP